MKPAASFKGQQGLRLGRFSQSGGIYHVISSTHQRSPLFLDFVLAQTAIRAFADMRLLKQNQLLCWVLMPDHVHWLVQLDQQSNLSNLIGVMKSASARQIRQKGYALKVWGDGFYQIARKTPPFRAGMNSADALASSYPLGVCCCSMSCRMISIGAPPQLPAK